jgi:hypothetical protein
MIQPEEPEKRKGFLDRLPRLGRVSQLMLVIGIFLVIAIPLLVVNRQQQPIQTELKATLANLQKVLAGEETPKGKLEAELAQIQAETEAARALFPSTNQAPEILDSLLELAEMNDIYVTQTKVSTSQPAGATSPVLTLGLTLKGQVPKFQNFLLALNDRLPTSQIKQAAFSIAEEEGEEDTAVISIDISCYEGGE